jgi:hypothetical protein
LAAIASTADSLSLPHRRRPTTDHEWVRYVAWDIVDNQGRLFVAEIRHRSGARRRFDADRKSFGSWLRVGGYHYRCAVIKPPEFRAASTVGFPGTTTTL